MPIISTSPQAQQAQEKLNALTIESRELDAVVSSARKRQREIREEAATLAPQMRPEFPNQVQKDGITVAIRRLRESFGTGGHEFEPTPTHTVAVVPLRGLISVRHDALPSPFTGFPFWSLNDNDIEAIAKLITDEGCSIFDQWEHSEGVSFLVNRPVE